MNTVAIAVRKLKEWGKSRPQLDVEESATWFDYGRTRIQMVRIDPRADGASTKPDYGTPVFDSVGGSSSGAAIAHQNSGVHEGR